MTFKPGDRAKAGLSDVTIIGVASNGMYACEHDNGAVGFLNPSDLMPPEPEQVARWVHLWCDNEITINKEPKQGRGMVIARTRVVLTPGQFDDDPYTKGWNEALEAAIAKWNQCGHGNVTFQMVLASMKKSAP